MTVYSIRCVLETVVLRLISGATAQTTAATICRAAVR